MASSLEARAQALDEVDPLANARDLFVIEDDLVYLDGNSLGRPTRESMVRAQQVLTDQWPHELVMGWDSWIDIGQRAGAALAPLIGAGAGEVALSDQTTINLFKLSAAALAATGRPNIVSDAANFPSDLYVLDAVARSAGGRLRTAPEDASPSEIDHMVDDTVGLVALTHVAYRSGAMHDGPAITAVAHEAGALILWDLAHSAGAVPVDLEAWGADLAVGCTYKYLNGGPGAPGFLYVRSSLHSSIEQPIAGWFGHRNQFGFEPGYDPDPSIRRFLVGTPSVVATEAASGGIDVIAALGIDTIRAKNRSLTSFFIEALDELDTHGVEVMTPRNPDRRGAHVTVRHPDAARISLALRSHRVIVDHRAPDLVRFGFAAPYVSHADAATAAATLHEVVTDGSYQAQDPSSSTVT